MDEERKTSTASETWKLIKPYLIPTALFWILYLTFQDPS